MGRVRTKTVKRAARLIIERHYPRLTRDFHTNKKICDEVATIQSKRLRNKIAGFITHLMARIEKGPVRGISFKLQEEERERRDNYVPAVSAVDTKHIEVDAATQAMLKAIGFGDLPGVGVQSATQDVRRGGRRQGDRRPNDRRRPNRSNAGSSNAAASSSARN
jgi:small subunit ribosomal protein S17e